MIIPLNKFKNIIFDLGGVILNIDYFLTINAFKELGIDNIESLFTQAHQKKLFDLTDKGQITPSEFRNEVRKLTHFNITDSEIDIAWNSMLLDLPAERLILLKKLRLNYRIFLLSNTNEIHIIEITKYLQKTFGIKDLSDYFEKMYLSYEIGMRKPDKELFHLLLNENNLLPNETLFIDDSIQHIESAKRLGIDGYWLDTNKESITDIFV